MNVIREFNSQLPFIIKNINVKQTQIFHIFISFLDPCYSSAVIKDNSNYNRNSSEILESLLKNELIVERFHYRASVARTNANGFIGTCYKKIYKYICKIYTKKKNSLPTSANQKNFHNDSPIQ